MIEISKFHIQDFKSRLRTKLKAKLSVRVAASKFYGQAKGLISSGQLSTLLHLHTHPINLVVYQESHCQD